MRHLIELISNVSEACQWLVDLLSSDKGPTYLKYVLLYVIEDCALALSG